VISQIVKSLSDIEFHIGISKDEFGASENTNGKQFKPTIINN
jgi:hypothetical protein